MTWIVDENGRRWVEPVARKKRKPAAVGRFDALKVGDFIMKKAEPTGPLVLHGREYAIVTDLWFDPVRGQHNPENGRMAAICWILRGKIHETKHAHSLRGLASNGYVYADMDPIAHHQAKVEAIEAGKVIGIGHGRVIRRRPKLPGQG